MAKTKTVTKVRAARKTTTEKRSKKDAEPKSKKAPSPYNLFVKVQLPLWKEANPGKSAKDAMSAVGVMWKDSPENPKNAGGGVEKAPKAKKPNSKHSVEADKDSPSSDTD